MFSFTPKNSSVVTVIEQESYEYERLRMYISRLLIFIGATLFFLYSVPIIITFGLELQHNFLSNKIYADTGKHTQEIAPKNLNPISASYWKRMFSPTYYDPGTSFIRQIQDDYSQTSSQTQVQIDQNYKKTMYIDIPSLQIAHLTLTPNVSGESEAEYQKALKKGPAHLKGTPLPGDGGNSIIYGHSGLPKLLGRYPDWLLFSKLEQTSLGDTIIIHKDEKELTYRVTSKKIVNLEQLQDLVKPTEQEQVTLITCWPLGIGSRRLVVIAQRYE